MAQSTGALAPGRTRVTRSTGGDGGGWAAESFLLPEAGGVWVPKKFQACCLEYHPGFSVFAFFSVCGCSLGPVGFETEIDILVGGKRKPSGRQCCFWAVGHYFTTLRVETGAETGSTLGDGPPLECEPLLGCLDALDQS